MKASYLAITNYNTFKIIFPTSPVLLLMLLVIRLILRLTIYKKDIVYKLSPIQEVISYIYKMSCCLQLTNIHLENKTRNKTQLDLLIESKMRLAKAY